MHRPYKHFVYLGLILSIVLGGGCRSGNEGAGDNDQDVDAVYAVSFGLYDLTRQLAGEQIDVRMPDFQGHRPIDWKPDASTILEMQKAKLIIANGPAASAAKWLNVASLPVSRIVSTTENIRLQDFIVVDDAPTHSHGPEGEHSHSGVVYTCWLDPRVAGDQADMIADELCKAFPHMEDEIKENQRTLKKDLQRLSGLLASQDSLKNKTVLSSEPSFKYIFRCLDIEDKHYFWSQEISPITEEMWTEFDASRPTTATVMVWPFDPPADVKTGLKERSIDVVVLDLLEYQRTDNSTYAEVLENNLNLLKNTLDEN